LSVQKHATKAGFEKILLPIDSSPATLEKVRFAAELAKKYNAHIYVLGILSFRDDEVAEKLERRMEQVEKFLDKKEVLYESMVVEGENLATITLKQAKKLKADLICIMTEQEENLTGLFMGPFAQQVVNHSRIPVLSIKPLTE
jgi:nucleotide-binding universal stress UspA family protein